MTISSAPAIASPISDPRINQPNIRFCISTSPMQHVTLTMDPPRP